MKKSNLLLLVSVLLFASINSYGQDDDKNKGVRAGWQSSNFYVDGEGADPLSSFYVGFTGEKSIIPLLKFGSGLEYFQNGTQTTIANETFQYKAHVISIPLYLKLKLGPVFALGGAAANFNIAHNYKVGDNSSDVPDDLKVNTFDVPVFAGLGVKILMFSIEARYHWGMLDTSKSDATDSKVQYFQIGAGISF